MNPALNMEPDTLPGTPAAPATALPAGRLFYWTLRRELWENRSIWIAPLAVAAVLLAGHLIATIGRALSIADLAERRTVLEEPSQFVALAIMAVAFVIAVFYCLDALYGERRDRSILFWKSLPVSDRMTVLVKATVPMLIIPLVCCVVALVTQWLVLIMNSLALSASGLDTGPLWEKAMFLENAAALLFHLVGIHGLWYAPIYGWLLLVSAWAQRVPLLWAVLPPAAVAAFEFVAFGTSHIRALIAYRTSGGAFGDMYLADTAAMHPLAHLSPVEFLLSPGLWLGFGVAAVFLLLAARIRGEREPE